MGHTCSRCVDCPLWCWYTDESTGNRNHLELDESLENTLPTVPAVSLSAPDIEEDSPIIWMQLVDPKTNELYYFNRITHESTWEKPKDFSLSTKVGATFEEAKGTVNWVEAKTKDGRTYYYDRVTRETRWDRPASLQAKTEKKKKLKLFSNVTKRRKNSARKNIFVRHRHSRTGKEVSELKTEIVSDLPIESLHASKMDSKSAASNRSSRGEDINMENETNGGDEEHKSIADNAVGSDEAQSLKRQNMSEPGNLSVVDKGPEEVDTISDVMEKQDTKTGEASARDATQEQQPEVVEAAEASAKDAMQEQQPLVVEAAEASAKDATQEQQPEVVEAAEVPSNDAMQEQQPEAVEAAEASAKVAMQEQQPEVVEAAEASAKDALQEQESNISNGNQPAQEMDETKSHQDVCVDPSEKRNTEGTLTPVDQAVDKQSGSKPNTMLSSSVDNSTSMTKEKSSLALEDSPAKSTAHVDPKSPTCHDKNLNYPSSPTEQGHANGRTTDSLCDAEIGVERKKEQFRAKSRQTKNTKKKNRRHKVNAHKSSTKIS